MLLKFDLKKIKFATDQATFARAVDLYEQGKVTDFKEGIASYSAVVEGGKPYQVSIEARRFGLGHCECYMAQKDYLCKHMVALSLQAVLEGKPLPVDDNTLVEELGCSDILGELNKEELALIKKEITAAVRYVKSYDGPSRTWFVYQDSLREGCRYLTAIFSKLPVSPQTATLIIKTLLKLDNKLSRGGADDSDGTVGDFIYEVVELLKEFVSLDLRCLETFELLCQQSTCFGWEQDLVKMYDER